MFKQFSWPYRLLVVLLLVGVYGFMRQPAVLVDELKATLKTKDEAAWQALTVSVQAQAMSKQLMQGLLKMKYAVDWQAGNRGDAMNSYYGALELVDVLSAKLAGTAGFAHFLCGDLASFPTLPENNVTGCWVLEGDLTWLSPTQVQVAFTNPEQGWQSFLILERNGLFSWRVAGVELPIEAMLAAYQKRLQG
ncbi:MAG: hypothetical protein RQ733_01830 [Methyloprofundus sp.]|nr:hypothetical protein [Methyloprofundus sp.]